MKGVIRMDEVDLKWYIKQIEDAGYVLDKGLEELIKQLLQSAFNDGYERRVEEE
jgi:hypothetical protein